MEVLVPGGVAFVAHLGVSIVFVVSDVVTVLLICGVAFMVFFWTSYYCVGRVVGVGSLPPVRICCICSPKTANCCISN